MSDAVVHIFSNHQFSAVNYIDDLGGAEGRDRAWEAFFTLGMILDRLGLQQAADKACPPSTNMTFLGQKKTNDSRWRFQRQQEGT